MKMKWDAILFDMDGTLIDIDMKRFLHDYFALWQKAVIKNGLEPAGFIKRLIASTDKMTESIDPTMTNEEVFWRAFSDEDFPYETYKPIADRFYQEEYLTLEPIVQRRPVMVELIQKLHGHVTLALATNSVFPRDAILKRLNWGGLDESYFDYIANYEDMHFCKPRPEYFLEIAQALNVDPKRCLVVGDDPQLDLVAHTLGMETFFLEVSYGQNAEWDGETIHIVTYEDRIRGREIADHHGDINDLEQFLLAGLQDNKEKN